MKTLIPILHSFVLVSFSYNPADTGKRMSFEHVLHSALHKGFLASLVPLHCMC